MDTKPKNQSRIVLLMICFALSFGLPVVSSDLPGSSACTKFGTAYAPYDDACYFYIILDNGLYLQPERSSIPERLYPAGPFRVSVGYEVLDSIASPCGTGFLVNLTCIEVINDTIGCFASFNYGQVYCDPMEGVYCGEYTYQFMNLSHGSWPSYQWDFGDGITSSEENPVHAFPGPGSYTVCLSIFTQDSCSSTCCKNIVVGDTMLNCMAMFDYFSIADCGDSIADCLYTYERQFIDRSFGNIISWSWDFGDGTTSSEQSPLHEFPGYGEYTVCLSIYSPDSCYDTYCTVVVIDGPSDCQAYFDYCNYSWVDSTISNDRYMVGFRNLSRGNPAYFWWEFGDGGYSEQENPVHIYENPGIYQVCLNISDYYGCYDTYCTSVTVGQVDCSVDFTYDIVFPNCIGFSPAYQFIPYLEGPVWYVLWDFGDGTFSDDIMASHIYEQSGEYDVCIQVYYENNCYASKCRTIFVTENEQDSVWYAKCNPNGIPMQQASDKLSVLEAYPNPASSILNLMINAPAEMEVGLKLVNLLGQVQDISAGYSLKAGENHLEVDLSKVETGNYIYLIYSNDRILHGKLSIVK